MKQIEVQNLIIGECFGSAIDHSDLDSFVRRLEDPTSWLSILISAISKAICKDKEEKICKNCKYWNHKSNDQFKECSNERFIIDIDNTNCPKNSFIYCGVYEAPALFKTGEEFGCVHFDKGDL